MVKRRTESLLVRMNGIEIGELKRLYSTTLQFKYHPDWLNHSSGRPLSLSMPLAETVYEGATVYNFFENLLPDNPIIRARLKTQLRANSDSPFDLLKIMGKDCIGAIQIVESTDEPFEKNISRKTLSQKEIQDLLTNYREKPLGMTQDDKEFRISVAGAQDKTALLFHENQWCKPLGSTPTTHILKLPIGYITHQHMDLTDSCENEWLCAQILKQFGLPVAESQILHFGDSKVLAIKRFDRKISKDKAWIMRLPQEDLCQAMGLAADMKYQSDGGAGIKTIMQLLLGSENPLMQQSYFLRTQIIFWLLAAIDGHAKNFSIFIKPKGAFQLTPLYDIMSAYPLIYKKQLAYQKTKMAMALIGKNPHYNIAGVQRRHFLSTAENSHFSKAQLETLLEEILIKAPKVINTVSQQIPKDFPDEISEPIFSGITNMVNRLKN